MHLPLALLPKQNTVCHKAAVFLKIVSTLQHLSNNIR
jgi:hypothetical protein